MISMNLVIPGTIVLFGLTLYFVHKGGSSTQALTIRFMIVLFLVSFLLGCASALILGGSGATDLAVGGIVMGVLMSLGTYSRQRYFQRLRDK